MNNSMLLKMRDVIDMTASLKLLSRWKMNVERWGMKTISQYENIENVRKPRCEMDRGPTECLTVACARC